MVFAIVARLLTTEGGPLQHKSKRFLTFEHDPEQETDMLLQQIKREQGNAITTGNDVGFSEGQEPKFHFEVHSVYHRMGHLATADQKLQSVIRQAAAVDRHRIVSTDERQTNDREPASVGFEPHKSDADLVPSKKTDQYRPPEMDDAHVPDDRTSHTSEIDVKQKLKEAGSREIDDELSPVAMARENPKGLTSVEAVGNAASIADVYFLAVVAGCSVAGIAGLLLAAVCWYRLHRKIKAASEVDYPAYGVTGPSAGVTAAKDTGGRGLESPGDRKLAQSAQMYHYQHQKQQMIASERLASDTQQAAGSDVESEEDNEEGDYTVFECPGLATNGEMEVRNPLFVDQTPASTPADGGSSAAPQGKK